MESPRDASYEAGDGEDEEDESFVEADITPLIPSQDGDIDFDAIDCLPIGEDTTVVDDMELGGSLGRPAIEVLGPESRITFYPNCRRPYLVIHFKTMDKFLSFSVLVRDDSGVNRLIEMSSRRSIVSVDKDIAQLPLQVSSARGWQRICLDFDHLLIHAFGTSFISCLELSIIGSCRVSTIFFQSQLYSDIELPEFLRVGKTES
jgi:Protein of unknown function (DUF667)